jgi:hypothetical protein
MVEEAVRMELGRHRKKTVSEGEHRLSEYAAPGE